MPFGGYSGRCKLRIQMVDGIPRHGSGASRAPALAREAVLIYLRGGRRRDCRIKWGNPRRAFKAGFLKPWGGVAIQIEPRKGTQSARLPAAPDDAYGVPKLNSAGIRTGHAFVGSPGDQQVCGAGQWLVMAVGAYDLEGEEIIVGGTIAAGLPATAKFRLRTSQVWSRSA